MYRIIFTFLCLVLLSSPGFAAVIFSENFSTNLNNWREQGGCYPYSFQLVADPCPNMPANDSANNQVLKVTNIMGDDNSVCPDPPWNQQQSNGTDTWYKHRAELMPDPSNTRWDYQVHYWVGMRTFADLSYPTATPLIFFHNTQMIPDPFDGPDMSLRRETNGRWQFDARNSNAGQNRTWNETDLGEFRRGHWVTWVIHYYRSMNNDGRAEVWRNNVKVVDYTGQTSQSTSDDAQWKIGLYRGALVPASYNGDTYIVYFDDVRLATGTNQFNNVDPLQNGSP